MKGGKLYAEFTALRDRLMHLKEMLGEFELDALGLCI